MSTYYVLSPILRGIESSNCHTHFTEEKVEAQLIKIGAEIQTQTIWV